VAYVGRVSTTKYCHELLDFFERYKAAHPDPLTLVLVGRVEIPIPERSDVIALGFVSDELKYDVLAGAEAFVLPSRFESLSMVFLESLGVGTPVLCSGASEVLRGHCLRSNAALYYDTFAEFEASLELLLSNRRLRQLLGRRGQQYVRQKYGWGSVVAKYERAFDQVVEGKWFG
jgi:glycosyltransferase involved in cell wall biosynthesis